MTTSCISSWGDALSSTSFPRIIGGSPPGNCEIQGLGGPRMQSGGATAQPPTPPQGGGSSLCRSACRFCNTWQQGCGHCLHLHAPLVSASSATAAPPYTLQAPPSPSQLPGQPRPLLRLLLLMGLPGRPPNPGKPVSLLGVLTLRHAVTGPSFFA